MLYLIPGWRRGKLENLPSTMLKIVSLGLDCLNPQLVSCPWNQEWAHLLPRVTHRPANTHVGATAANMGGQPLGMSWLVIVRISFSIKRCLFKYLISFSLSENSALIEEGYVENGSGLPEPVFAGVANVSLRSHFWDQVSLLSRFSSRLLAKPWWMLNFLRGFEFGPLSLSFWPRLCILKMHTRKLRHYILLTPALAQTGFDINLCLLNSKSCI